MAASTPPLSLGEILDRTVQLYRRNFLLFLGISFLPAAFDVLVSGSMGIFFTSRASVFQTPAGGQQLVVFILVFLLFLLLGVPLLVGVFSLALTALNQAAFQRNQGEPATIRDAYAYGFRHFWRYLGILALQLLFAGVLPGVAGAGIVFIGAALTAVIAASGIGKAFAVLSGLFLFLMVIALAVVAMWIWLRYCLAFPVCVTEQQKPWPCMQRSSRLSKGSRGRLFVMYLLVVILTVIVYYVLTLPVDIVLKLTLYKSMAGLALFSHPPVVLQVINLFISFLERSFAMPIYSIALLLFYNDQRTRQEGYDIELLMAQAGWSELPQPAPAPTVSPFVEASAQPAPAEINSESDRDSAPTLSPPEVSDTEISNPEVSGA